MGKKEIIKALENHLGVKARYLGTPSFAYQIQNEVETYTVTREGIILDAEGREIELDSIFSQPERIVADTGISLPRQVVDEAAITIPLDGHTGATLRNLINMIYSKQNLIVKALSLESELMDADLIQKLNEANIETTDDFETLLEVAGNPDSALSFNFAENYFTIKLSLSDPDQINAAVDLFGCINQISLTLKSASYKAKETDNEKYTFRTWLLRLGMIGGQFKTTRKVLLANLEGSSAFRRPSREGEHYETRL